MLTEGTCGGGLRYPQCFPRAHLRGLAPTLLAVQSGVPYYVTQNASRGPAYVASYPPTARSANGLPGPVCGLRPGVLCLLTSVRVQPAHRSPCARGHALVPAGGPGCARSIPGPAALRVSAGARGRVRASFPRRISKARVRAAASATSHSLRPEGMRRKSSPPAESQPSQDHGAGGTALVTSTRGPTKGLAPQARNRRIRLRQNLSRPGLTGLCFSPYFRRANCNEKCLEL